MKIKLDNFCVLVGFYHDRDAGERLLKNLEELKINSLWADSRVDGFHQYNNSDTSLDGLPEMIDDSDYARLYPLGITKPGEGMSFLLKKASHLKYKYTVTLGCDEYLEGEVDIFRDALNRMNLKEPTKLRMPIIEHVSLSSHGGKIAERIVYMPEYVFLKDAHYVYFHNYFGYDKPMAVKKWESPLVLGLTIHHDDSIRSPERNIKMDEYQQSQKKREFDSILQMIKKNEI